MMFDDATSMVSNISKTNEQEDLAPGEALPLPKITVEDYSQREMVNISGDAESEIDEDHASSRASSETSHSKSVDSRVEMEAINSPSAVNCHNENVSAEKEIYSNGGNDNFAPHDECTQSQERHMMDSKDTTQQTTSSKSRSINRAQLLSLDKNQMSLLPFPIGCNVSSEFQHTHDGQSFKCGKVVGAFLYLVSSELLFEVLLDYGCTSWHGINELAFAPNSQVYYSPSEFSKRDEMPGKIILAKTNLSTSNVCYSIMVSKYEGTDGIKIVQDIPCEQIKYQRDS